MAEPLRTVLQVITSTDRRGAELFATELGSALGERGWVVRTMALAPGRGVNRLELPTLGPRALHPKTLRALRGEMGRAEVTIAHGSRTLPATALATLGTRSRVVYRNIGDPGHWSSTRMRRARVGWALRRATAVIALSDASSRHLAEVFRIPAERITVIPQGVDARRFRPADDDERRHARRALGLLDDTPVVAWIGALVAEKDPALALTAVDRIGAVQALVVGDGPLRHELERRHASPSTHFVGMLTDPAPCLAAADVVVLTSASEGMPAALIEAGLSGLPVVSTDVGFIRDIVVPDVTGIIVGTRDPEDIARSLRRAIAQREEFGAAAREHCATRFDLAHVADRWDGALRSIVDR